MVGNVGQFVKVSLVQIIICFITMLIENSIAQGFLRSEVDKSLDKECIEFYENNSL